MPTYNRKETLVKSIYALFAQSYPKNDFEIIVIDDGSTDGTGELINMLLANSPCILRYYRQVNSGPGAARNVGIKMAQGELILFIDDDIIPGPTLLESHFNWHLKYPDDKAAVLGYVEWSPDINVTPFMRWLDNGGPHFKFYKIGDASSADPSRFFYTCNISLKRKFLLGNCEFFDEEFSIAGWEDLEFGHRLKKRGLELKFDKEARAYHFRYVSFQDACKRMFKIGQTSHIIEKKIQRGGKDVKEGPCLRKYLKKIKLIVKYPKFKLYYLLGGYFEKRTIKASVFEFVLNYCYMLGALNIGKELKIKNVP